MDLEFEKIFHAGFIVRSGGIQGLCDPVVTQPFADVLVAHPSCEIDEKRIAKTKWDFIFISHGHSDHFDPASLRQFKKSIPVYTSKASEQIVPHLKKLGFKNVSTLGAWETKRFGSLEMMIVPNADDHFESAVAFRAGKNVVMNLIDTLVGTKVPRQFIKKWGKPTLLFAPFMPVGDLRVFGPTAGRQWDRALYRKMQKQASLFNARYISAGSSDEKHVNVEWVNHRLFPITRNRFMTDMKQSGFTGKFVHGLPGTSFVIKSGKVKAIDKKRRMTKVVDTSGDFEAETEFKTKLKLRPFLDFQEYSTNTKKNDAYALKFATNFETWLQTDGAATMKARFPLKLRWRFVVHSKSGVIFDQEMNFRSRAPRWQEPGPKTELRTDVVASGLYGIEKNLLGLHAFIISDLMRITGPIKPEMRDPLLLFLISLYGSSGYQRALSRDRAI